jgi:hypothetical protein
MSYDEFIKLHKRCLVSDKTDVRKVDSVHQDRDASMAWRGLKKLNEW